MNKNSEVRYSCSTEHKEELISVAKNVLGLNHEQSFNSIMELGLAELRTKLSNTGLVMKIEHIPNSQVKRIYFKPNGDSK